MPRVCFRQLFSYITKERQTESLVEKLCQRFRTATCVYLPVVIFDFHTTFSACPDLAVLSRCCSIQLQTHGGNVGIIIGCFQSVTKGTHSQFMAPCAFTCSAPILPLKPLVYGRFEWTRLELAYDSCFIHARTF